MAGESRCSHGVFRGFWGHEESDEGTNSFDLVSQLYSPQEQLGPQLPEQAVNLANQALRSVVSLKRKRLQRRFSDQLMQKVCKCLELTWTFGKLSFTRLGRLTFVQCIQTLLHKGLTPLLELLSRLKEIKDKDRKDKENLKKALDAFQVLALTSVTISNVRKTALSQDILPQYKPSVLFCDHSRTCCLAVMRTWPRQSSS